MNGPSPRVRGELAFGGACRVFHRAIPACAGRTERPDGPAPVVVGPSPRVRGERRGPWANLTESRAIPACAGRTASTTQAVDPEVRAIPACAGRTLRNVCIASGSPGPSPRVRGELVLSTFASPTVAGHPRVCGENVFGVLKQGIEIGPSPRVRGERSVAVELPTSCNGPSPRVRGEPSGPAPPEPGRAGHPRVCGENARNRTGP